MMNRKPALRTPDERFQALPGWTFEPHYIADLPGFEGLRVHYIDEGPKDAKHTFLCLHGEPTWSYLYRKMIPIFASVGRVIAVDFLGFGRSDKLTQEADYTFDMHRTMLIRFIERLDLQNITLVCQDWGGLLGLTLPMDMPHRFKRLLVMNTSLGTGEALGKGFLAWRAYNNATPDLDIGSLIKRGTPHLTAEEQKAYDAPYPDASYKVGVRRFPNLVPDSPNAPGAEISRRARDWWRTQWNGESFMAIGKADPVLGMPAMKQLHSWIKGCPPPLVIEEAGHFVQEWGDTVARAALEHWAQSSEKARL
jgi:haloalkane dehalogenase